MCLSSGCVHAGRGVVVLELRVPVCACPQDVCMLGVASLCLSSGCLCVYLSLGPVCACAQDACWTWRRCA